VSGRRTNPAFPVGPELTPSARRLVSVAEVSLRRSGGGHPFERRQPTDVTNEVLQADLGINEVLQADFGARPDDADGTHEAAAGRRLLRTEHMFDAGADAALHAVRRCLGFRQRMTTRRAYMNAATEALRPKVPKSSPRSNAPALPSTTPRRLCKDI
jgi:hypothetical protein